MEEIEIILEKENGEKAISLEIETDKEKEVDLEKEPAIYTFESEADTTIEDGLITHTLSNYSNDRVTSIGYGAFYQNTNLTSASFENATTIGAYAFGGCTSLTNLSLPKATKCGSYSFEKAGFIELNLPAMTNSTTSTFARMPNLKTLVLPKIATMGNSSARDNSKLEIVDLGVCTKIDLLAFHNCSKLTKLIIRTESVCTLANVSGLTNTPIASGTGYVYVPDELVEEYKVASNWSTYASQIKGISELGEK